MLFFILASCGDSATGPDPVPQPEPVPEEPGSPVGQVAYGVFAPASGAWSLARRSLDGGDPIHVPLERGNEDGLPDRAVHQIRWSPDGTSLLYQSTKTFTDDWYFVLVDTDGTNRRLLTPHGGFAIDPEFSPAGDRVLYKRKGLSPVGLGIPTQTSIVDLAGVSTDVFLDDGGLIEGRRVYFDQNEDPSEALYDAQWAGDGEHLYVVGFFDASPTLVVPTVDKIEVFEVSLATGRALRRVTRNALDETRFHASPDGTRLIVRLIGDSGSTALLLTLGQSAEPTVITRDSDGALPRWATDSRHLSFGTTDGIWLVDIDGDRSPVKLAEGSGGDPANTWPAVHVER